MSLLLDALKRAEQAKRANTEGAPGNFTPSTVERTRELKLEEATSPPSSTTPAAPESVQTAGQAPAIEPVQREAARNVFAAKQPLAAPRPAWHAPALGIGAFALGALAWWGWKQLVPPAPTVIAAPAATSPSASLNVAATTTGQPGTRTSATALPPTPAPTATIPPLLPPPVASAPISLAPSRVTPPPLPPVPPVPPVPPPRALSERELLVRNLKSSRTAPEAPVSLKLSAKIETAVVSPQMTAAYAALLRGDYADAQKRYAELVQATPQNIDAHLGLAAAASRAGGSDNLALAARAYQRALAIDPRNQTAIVGLLTAIEGAPADALANELKKQLALNPNSPALHFALGNTYAAERRWTEAQQAYFEAYRLDGSDADTLYNLAVSLDQLGQGRLALEYYEKAIAPNTSNGGQFERAAVARRITELQATR